MYVIVKYGSALGRRLFFAYNKKQQVIWTTNKQKAFKFSSIHKTCVFMKENPESFQSAFDYQIELED